MLSFWIYFELFQSIFRVSIPPSYHLLQRSGHNLSFDDLLDLKGLASLRFRSGVSCEKRNSLFQVMRFGRGSNFGSGNTIQLKTCIESSSTMVRSRVLKTFLDRLLALLAGAPSCSVYLNAAFTQCHGFRPTVVLVVKFATLACCNR